MYIALSSQHWQKRDDFNSEVIADAQANILKHVVHYTSLTWATMKFKKHTENTVFFIESL